VLPTPLLERRRDLTTPRRIIDKMSEIEKMNEPLLCENDERFCMFPIKYPEIWEMYKKVSETRPPRERAMRTTRRRD